MSNFDCVPSMHGRRHLEFEITYPLDRAASGRETYRLDAWFFIPHPLQHWCEFNPREQFFHDLIAYTRFKAFPLPLSVLTDMHEEDNPLRRIHAMTTGTALDAPATQKKLIYELRMLVNTFQHQCRGQCAMIDRMASGANYPVRDVEIVATGLLDDVKNMLAAFATLEPIMLAPHVPETVRNHYRWADESLSIRAEKNYFRLCRTLTKSGILPQLIERCRGKIAAQIAHRRAHHYETVVDPANDRTNELFSFREHQLKKWAESAMYMTLTHSRMPERMMHVSFGVAAAVAMGFAVAAALAAEAYFHVRSYPWAILAVVAYVFKDRIKDILRGWSQRWLPRLTADRMQRLINPYSSRRAGLTRERVRILNIKQIPREVHRMRHNRQHAYLGLTPKEDILHYNKEVNFRSACLRAAETRLTALCEILRLDMRHWFYKMDKSDDELVYIEDGAIRTLKARRVYHINVILRLTHNGDNSEPPALYRYRVVANRSGIVRIEEAAG